MSLDELEFTDEPEEKGSTGSGKTRSTKYKLDVSKEAVVKLAELLKNRQEAGYKPKGTIPLRENHSDAPPSIEGLFLSELDDEVEYVGYRRKPERSSLSQEEYDDTETSQFTEGLCTDLWKSMIVEAGDEYQEVFGGSADEPSGRLHVGKPYTADLDERNQVVVRWRDTENSRTEFTEVWDPGQEESDEPEDTDE